VSDQKTYANTKGPLARFAAASGPPQGLNPIYKVSRTKNVVKEKQRGAARKREIYFPEWEGEFKDRRLEAILNPDIGECPPS
jgi:hypothetical protein